MTHAIDPNAKYVKMVKWQRRSRQQGQGSQGGTDTRNTARHADNDRQAWPACTRRVEIQEANASFGATV